MALLLLLFSCTLIYSLQYEADIISPLTSQLRTESRKIAIKYVGLLAV